MTAVGDNASTPDSASSTTRVDREAIVAATIRGSSYATQVAVLLRAKVYNLRPNRRGRVGRFLIAVIFAFVVFVGAYRTSAWGASLIISIDPTDPRLGVLVMRRMIEMGSLLLLSALGISNLITALTTFFLARDLDLLHPAPIRPLAFYSARLIEVSVQSAWVLVPVVIPMFFGVGTALHVGLVYFIATPFVVLAMVVPISAIAVAFATTIARFVPATRAKEVFLLLAGLMFVSFYIALRAARPEQFIDPQRFKTLPQLLESLGVSTPWLPSTWAADLLMALSGRVDGTLLQPTLSLAGFVGISLGGGALVHHLFYEKSHSRAREVRPRPARRADALVSVVALIGRLFGRRGVDHAILVKEARTVLRDPQQWTQILMLGALLVLFVYNFRFLNDLRLPNGVDLVFNLAISGFVIGALGARFVYPMVSLEGSAFWVLRSAPISTEAILKAKAWAAFIVLELLSVAMAVSASVALDLPVMSILLSVVLVTPLAYMASVLGIGLGATYPRFSYENPMMIPMSFGGMMYVYWSLGTVLVYSLLLGWPLYAIHARGRVLADPVTLGLTAILAAIALAVPFISGWVGFRMGVNRLDEEAGGAR